MKTTLENDNLRVQVQHKGAELCSLWHKEDQAELLWQADPAFWPRHSPLLFPIVGRLKNDSYRYNGQTYSLPQHGFARDMVFTPVAVSATEAVFELEHSPETLQRYPFPFRLQLSYTLHTTMLTCTSRVYNPGTAPMLFSIGAHPAFACDFGKQPTLVFNKNEEASRLLLHNGLFSGVQQPLLSGNTLPLTEELFADDALVFRQLQSDAVSLHTGSHRLRIGFAGYPYLGIWKKPQAPFICIEPWYGLADFEPHTGELENKEGIQLLEPGKTFEAAWHIKIHDSNA